MPHAKPPRSRSRTKPPPLRPWLCDRVHAALVKASRPVTRSELSSLFLSNTPRVADIQAALDVLIAEGLAARDEEGPIRGRWRVSVVYRALGKEQA